MEQGRQKSKTLSQSKAVAIFGIDESNVQLWQKHKAAISRCKASQRKFTGPKQG
jgi:hypothetical protein